MQNHQRIRIDIRLSPRGGSLGRCLVLPISGSQGCSVGGGEELGEIRALAVSQQDVSILRTSTAELRLLSEYYAGLEAPVAQPQEGNSTDL